MVILSSRSSCLLRIFSRGHPLTRVFWQITPLYLSYWEVSDRCRTDIFDTCTRYHLVVVHSDDHCGDNHADSIILYSLLVCGEEKQEKELLDYLAKFSCRTIGSIKRDSWSFHQLPLVQWLVHSSSERSIQVQFLGGNLKVFDSRSVSISESKIESVHRRVDSFSHSENFYAALQRAIFLFIHFRQAWITPFVHIFMFAIIISNEYFFV